MCRNEMNFLDWVIKILGFSSWANSHFLLDFFSHTKGSKDMSSGTLWTGHMVRNWALPATTWVTWKNILLLKPLSDWSPTCHPNGFLARDSKPEPAREVRYPEIFNPQKLWNNTCCYLRLWSFGITCCVAPDN